MNFGSKSELNDLISALASKIKGHRLDKEKELEQFNNS